MSRPWRLARSLETLREQINQLAPDRDKSSDGTIGDAAHQARKSDHNPDRNGVVRAIDITHDPASGVDCRELAEQLRESRDARISYVISDRRIFNSRVSPWEWRPYRGSNPHTKHMHVSAVAERARYDDTRPWDVALTARAGEMPSPLRRRLERGDDGFAVEELQRLLGIPSDGVFGAQTEAAVRAFQAGHGLLADGIVGPYTWEALLEKGEGPYAQVMRGITATMFGGADDPNRSAYDNHTITDDELGIALPWRFPDERPLVRVVHEGRDVTAPIVDVGPWNTDDPYWQTGSRPQAESGRDHRGRTTNLAGIDLTPAAAAAIGLPGKGLVDWEFVGVGRHQAEPPSPRPPIPTGIDNILAEITDAIRPVLEKRVMPEVTSVPPRPSEADWLEMLELLKRQAAPAPAPLSFIDRILGGERFVGKKTIGGIIGLIGTLAGVKTGVADPNGIWVEVLTWVFTGLAGAGFIAKIDRALKLGIEYLPKILAAITRLSEAITKQQSQHSVRQP